MPHSRVSSFDFSSFSLLLRRIVPKRFLHRMAFPLLLVIIGISQWLLLDGSSETIVYSGLLIGNLPGFLKKHQEKIESFEWIDNLPLASIMVQANDSLIIASNKAGVDLFGITPEKKVEFRLMELLNGGMHSEDWNLFIEKPDGKKSGSLTVRSREHYAVNIFWKQVSVEPDQLLLFQFSEIQRLSIDRFHSLSNLKADDTSEKLNQSLSHHPLNMLDGILSTYPIAMCITSPDGGFCWQKTTMAETLFGMYGDELFHIPRWWERRVLPEDASRLSLFWKELASSGRFEKRIKIEQPGKGIQEIKWVAQTQYDNSGNPSLVYHYFSELPRTSPSEWSSIVSSLEKRESGIAKWSWDRKAGKVNWSPEFYTLHELSRQTQPDISLPFPYMSENARFDLKLLLETMSDSHLPLSTEYKIKLPDGRNKDFVLIVGEVMTAETGETEFLSGIIKDVSNDKEQRRIQLELMEELSRHKQLIKEFSTALSHRLRVPVAQLQGVLGIILNQGGISRDRQLEYLTECATELDSALHEMNDLINNEKEVDGVSESFTWQEIWKPIAQEFQKKIIETQASVMVDFSGASKVVGIKENLQGILGELLNNAIRFRDTSRLLELYVHTEIVDSYTWFHIQDNGTGINLTGKEQVPFELYKRFHPNISGKGFGLHLVKVWIESMKGQVSMTSIEGQGTRVSFGIPFEE